MRACGAASQCVTCVPRAAAQEDRVEALGRMLRHHLAQRVCGELQVRAAVGLPPRSSFSITAAKYRDPQEGAIFASLAGGADDESSEMAEELQRFILRRVLLGWREESGRNGGGLVHAIAVWGWRRSLEAADALVALVDAQITPKPRAAIAGTAGAPKPPAGGTATTGSAIAALFSAKRAYACARGFMADFPAHAPSDAAQGDKRARAHARTHARTHARLHTILHQCGIELSQRAMIPSILPLSPTGIVRECARTHINTRTQAHPYKHTHTRRLRE